MPLYEYRCRSCTTRFEVLQAVGADNAGVTCPVCGDAGRVEKQFSTFSGGTSRERGGAGASSPAPSCGGGRSGFG